MAIATKNLAAATWTDLSTEMATVGGIVNVIVDAADCKIGLKATAPTDGIVMTINEAVEVQNKVGSTLKLWAYSTAGAKVTLMSAGAKRVVVDGTGTT